MRSLLNFRDAGGYPTIDGKRLKRGILYRSGSMDKARSVDIKEIQSLGIKTIIDLRSISEQKRSPKSLKSAKRVNIPFDFEDYLDQHMKPIMYKRNKEQEIIEIITTMYGKIADFVFLQLKEIFKILLSLDSLPILIHCRAGKDRTGFVYAILHLALGVETKYVIQDYLKSNDFILPEAKQYLKFARFFTLGLLHTDNLLTTFTANEKYIRTVIDKINNEYGGIEQYLMKCGIGIREFEMLRNLFLETPRI
jgi:protein-tyrosine phosphatase